MAKQHIAVIVPAHNSSSTLAECLTALRNQTDGDYEILVVDDGSSDASPKICRELDVPCLSLPRNKGQAVARNAEAAQTSGDLLAFTDSDVVVPPEWLSKFRVLLRKYPDAAMVCSKYKKSLDSEEPAQFAFHENEYKRLHIPLHEEAEIGLCQRQQPYPVPRRQNLRGGLRYPRFQGL